MKDDAPMPDAVPRKRRQLEQAPDVWLATWAARQDLAPSDRRRVEGERQRRRELLRTPERSVGLLVGQEGVTPAQLAALSVALQRSGATEVHHPGVARQVHHACRALGVPVEVHRGDMREVVRSSSAVIAAPRREGVGDVWEMLRYAKHRSLPVTVARADGTMSMSNGGN